MPLIAVYGADGSGKSTIVTELCQLFNERYGSTQAWRFPNRTTVTGPLISDCLRNAPTEGPGRLQEAYRLQSLMLANRLEARFDPRTWNILDRWKWCGTVYGRLDCLDLGWLRKIVEPLEDPIFNIVLNEAPSVCIARIKARTNIDARYERHPETYIAAINSGYLREAAEFGRPTDYPVDRTLVVTDPHKYGSAKETARRIFDVLVQRIEKCP